MALQKPITISSVIDPVYAASNCNDGIVDEICHTQGHPSNWLRIDLGGRKIITFMIINNRADTSANRRRLSNSDLYVFDNEDPNDNRRLCAHIEDGEPLIHLLRCTKPLFARNVELLQPVDGSNRFLNIREISVY